MPWHRQQEVQAWGQATSYVTIVMEELDPTARVVECDPDAMVETKQVEEAYMFAKGNETITGNRIDHMLISHILFEALYLVNHGSMSLARHGRLMRAHEIEVDPLAQRSLISRSRCRVNLQF